MDPRLHPCQFYCYTERQGHAATGEPLAGSNRQRSRLPGRNPKFSGIRSLMVPGESTDLYGNP